MAALPQEYRHEPDMALRAGSDGLDVVRRILARRRRAPRAGRRRWSSKWATATSGCSRRIRGVPFIWLEFEHGGGGVFLLTKDELRRHRRELSGAG